MQGALRRPKGDAGVGCRSSSSLAACCCCCCGMGGGGLMSGITKQARAQLSVGNDALPWFGAFAASSKLD